MKPTLVCLVAVSIGLLTPGLMAEPGPSAPSPSAAVTPSSAAGFPALPPVPQTGRLHDQPSASHFRFVAAGDNRPGSSGSSQPKTLAKIFKDGQKFNPAFFIWAGDIIYGHEYHRKKLERQYREFFGIAQAAKVPVFNAPPADRQAPSPNGPSYVVSGGAGAPLDSCPNGAGPNCAAIHHYLVFEVDHDTVRVQVVTVD